MGAGQHKESFSGDSAQMRQLLGLRADSVWGLTGTP